MSHSCKTLVLHCIDFRLGKAITEYLEKEKLLGDCDIVSVAGGVKNIASPKDEADRDFLLNQIAISKRLHDIKEIILMNHTDCGAYGGHTAFPSSDQEITYHREEMKKAKDIILRFYPDIAVRTLLADIEENGAVSITP